MGKVTNLVSTKQIFTILTLTSWIAQVITLLSFYSFSMSNSFKDDFFSSECVIKLWDRKSTDIVINLEFLGMTVVALRISPSRKETRVYQIASNR